LTIQGVQATDGTNVLGILMSGIVGEGGGDGAGNNATEVRFGGLPRLGSGDFLRGLNKVRKVIKVS